MRRQPISAASSLGDASLERRRGKAWQACLVALCLALAPGVAQPGVGTAAPVPGDGSCGVSDPARPRPRIGLALGGGGARGFAHIGVLRKIESLGIRVDCIAGTSMGALVGGLYASGMTADELGTLVDTTDWKQLFDDSLDRAERSYRRKQDDRDSLATIGVGVGRSGLRVSPGLLQGERILAMLERSTLGVSAIDDFDRLPIPYRAVATDLNTGQAVVLDQGSLAMAMRASMSLPGIFQPVEIDGRVLVDGGLANQVPVDVVRDMGADIVIAVDVGTPLEALDRNANLLQVVSQITGMMTTGNTHRQLATLGERDVLVAPELGDAVSTADFAKAREALAIGDRAAEAAHVRLAALVATDGNGLASTHAGREAPHAVPVIEFVRLENETAYADAMLLRRLDIPLGEPLDAEELESRIMRIYNLGTLASVTYEVVGEGGSAGVVLRARPKPQGPNYLQLGLDHSSDLQGSSDTTVRAALLFSPLSPLGAEGRLTAAIGSEPALAGEYYHPLDLANRNLLYARAAYENPNIHVFDAEGNNVATYDVREFGLRLQAGREFGNHGAAVLGVEVGQGKADVEIGDPLLDAYEFDRGRLFASLNIDRLDSLFFPRNGYYATLGYAVSREWLGADSEYSQVDFDAVAVKGFGRHAAQIGGRWHVTVSGTAPVQDLYRLGGRTRLVGYRVNELSGQHYGLVYMGYSYQLADLFGRSAQVGGTLEYGNVWQRRSDMSLANGIWNGSLYIGFDSWIGPMMFGYGWREAGRGVFFIEIGKAL